MGGEGTQGGGSGTSQPPGCPPRAEQLAGEAAVSSMSPTRLSSASHYGQRRRRRERVTDTAHAWQRPRRPTELCFCSSVFSPHAYQDLKHQRAARGWGRHVEPPPRAAQGRGKGSLGLPAPCAHGGKGLVDGAGGLGRGPGDPVGSPGMGCPMRTARCESCPPIWGPIQYL